MRRPKTVLLFGLMTAFGCGSSTNNNGGTVQFTASGEVLALGGYDFPPAAGSNNPVFVDGWQVVFDEVLVTFDNITLSQNPDTDPRNQSLTGPVVAQVTGPWAVDLHKGGPLPGKGGSNEQAIFIANVTNQNKNSNKPFDETVRYAFGFDIVRATNSAQKLNFDATNTADYNTMIQNGWAVFYSGTATFKGTGCTTQPATPNYPFNAPPMNTTVKFKFGFATPTTYINCQNPDLSGQPFPNEEHPRGVQVKNNQTTIAQATVHTDHPFWESFVHDTPPHFDQLASRAQFTGGNWVVTLNDVTTDNYTGFTDTQGRALPWRKCPWTGSTYNFPDTSVTMHFDDQGITQPNYAAYMAYNQSTQGHLNSDGLCAVQRHF